MASVDEPSLKRVVLVDPNNREQTKIARPLHANLLLLLSRGDRLHFDQLIADPSIRSLRASHLVANLAELLLNIALAEFAKCPRWLPMSRVVLFCFGNESGQHGRKRLRLLP